VWRLLKRLGITYRRGQEHLHSPDPEYASKLAALNRARRQARRSRGKIVLVYLDELTFYRRPSVARCYTKVGGPGRYAEQGHGVNRTRRVIGALDGCGGQLTSWQGDKAGVRELGRFYRRLLKAYPKAKRIWVAQDNWPVHFLSGVTDPLQKTTIRLLRLPTYAPWTNPIEKVWHKLKQEVLHQHEYANDWRGLRDVVADWLTTTNPQTLLRYTGLRKAKTTHR